MQLKETLQPLLVLLLRFTDTQETAHSTNVTYFHRMRTLIQLGELIYTDLHSKDRDSRIYIVSVNTCLSQGDEIAKYVNCL